MRMLVQRTPISMAAPFALEELKEYLKFTPDMGDVDDAELDRLGMEAAAEVEHFAQTALLTQTVRVTIVNLRHGPELVLPVGPLAEDPELTVTINGHPFTDCEAVATRRPCILWPDHMQGQLSPRVVIQYRAGFGDDATAMPRDLKQAILDQAAMVYDERAPADRRVLARSTHLARIAAKYRGVSV